MEIIVRSIIKDLDRRGFHPLPVPPPKCDIHGHERKGVLYLPDVSTGQSLSCLGRRSGGAKPLERLNFIPARSSPE